MALCCGAEATHAPEFKTTLICSKVFYVGLGIKFTWHALAIMFITFISIGITYSWTELKEKRDDLKNKYHGANEETGRFLGAQLSMSEWWTWRSTHVPSLATTVNELMVRIKLYWQCTLTHTWDLVLITVAQSSHKTTPLPQSNLKKIHCVLNI